jgi:serine protease inhibitor
MDCARVQRNRRQEVQKARKHKALCRAILKRLLFLTAFLPQKNKAHLEVNEKGTEAAAATAAVFAARAVRIQERPREFRADHPFLFLIRDSTTGSLLFIGRVVNPGA